jgi:hypothetical protein
MTDKDAELAQHRPCLHQQRQQQRRDRREREHHALRVLLRGQQWPNRRTCNWTFSQACWLRRRRGSCLKQVKRSVPTTAHRCGTQATHSWFVRGALLLPAWCLRWLFACTRSRNGRDESSWQPHAQRQLHRKWRRGRHRRCLANSQQQLWRQRRSAGRLPSQQSPLPRPPQQQKQQPAQIRTALYVVHCDQSCVGVLWSAYLLTVVVVVVRQAANSGVTPMQVDQVVRVKRVCGDCASVYGDV